MRRKPRVIVDTNVVISGLLSKASYPSRVIDAWLAEKFVSIISKGLQEEINEVIRRFKIRRHSTYDLKNIKRLLGILFNKAEKIKVKKLTLNISIDEKDHFLLELAVISRADIIISGDQEILVCSYKDLVFLSPKDFCERYL